MSLLFAVVVVAAVSLSVIHPAPAHADIDTTPPIAAIFPNGQLTAVQRITFDETVSGVTNDSIVLRFRDTTSNLPVSLRCKNASGIGVSCAGSDIRAVDMHPASALIAGGEYTIIVNPEGATTIVDQTTNVAATTPRSFSASVVEQESSAGATYVWRTVSDSRAYGGSYRTDNAAGSMAIFRFIGTSVTWYTQFGPDQGIATVTIDGKVVGTFSNYRATKVLPASRSFRGLANKSHVMVVVVRNQKYSASRGTWVTVDAVRANSGPYLDATYVWPAVSASSAAGRRFARSATAGSRVAFTFIGGGVDWMTVTGPYEGKAVVYIDGKVSRVYDNYSATTQYNVRRTVAGLSPSAIHTLTIVTAGSKNAASRGTFVSVDQWVLRADITVFRKLGAWVDLYDYTSSTTRSTIQARLGDMKARGVKTLYLQTGRYNTNTFHWPTQMGWWLEEAHARGIAVVGWYFPAYSEYLSGDIAKAAAIASYVSPGGHRFNGLAIDIEYRAKTDSKTEFFNGITAQLAGVRSRVGIVFPVGAITFAPLDMDRWVAGWSGFPWASVTRYANAVMPMGYWSTSSNRDRCAAGQSSYCPYQFTLQNILRTRSYTGLPVHNIGGVGNSITAAEVAQYVQAERDAHAWGGSLYDYATTASSFWAPLANLNTL